MRVYDAKVQQKCKICNLTFNNNKSGRFTSHLNKDHEMTLEEYLTKYFYTKEQITCHYEFCDKVVKLRRGIPNKFYSRTCRMMGEPLICVSSRTCASQLKSFKTTAWHERMDSSFKEKHFSAIISKTAKTRRLNKTPSWNSGKTGIYSEEAIEKIRNATLRQLAEAKFQKTSIECTMEKLLQKMKLNYQYSYITNGVQYDFYLKDYGILIECDGDYWHANPRFYPDENELYETQKRIRKRDLLKNEIAEKLNFTLLRFWEYDINNHLDQVEQRIINALSATT